MLGPLQIIYDLFASPDNKPLPRVLEQFLRHDYFVVFWFLTLIAFTVRRTWVRRVYLVFFFCSIFAVGLIGIKQVVAWPFFHWHLWARHLPQTFTFYEVEVEDTSGQLLPYDCRACLPLIPEILRMRFASRMLSSEDGEVIARWLLERAQTYGPELAPLAWAGFPLRTPGPSWPPNHKRFVAVLVKKTRVELGPTPEDSVFTPLMEKKFQ